MNLETDSELTFLLQVDGDDVKNKSPKIEPEDGGKLQHEGH